MYLVLGPESEVETLIIERPLAGSWIVGLPRRHSLQGPGHGRMKMSGKVPVGQFVKVQYPLARWNGLYKVGRSGELGGLHWIGFAAPPAKPSFGTRGFVGTFL